MIGPFAMEANTTGSWIITTNVYPEQEFDLIWESGITHIKISIL